MFSNVKALCCACIFFFGGSAMAAGTQAQPSAAPNQNQAKAPSMKSAEKVLGGPVTAINPEKKEITISRNSVKYPILVTGSTQIVSGNQPIDFSTIAVGDKVTVTYTKMNDGARNAVNIKKTSSGSSVAPEAGMTAKHKSHVKAEPKKTEAPAATKAEVKKEVKAEVKAEAKKEMKAEAQTTAPAAPKAEVTAEPKKVEPAAAAPAATNPEVKKVQAPDTSSVKTQTKVAPK
jgi:hypothetical protein